MIEIIAGEKGKGKTKELLAKVNHSVTAASGNIVYLVVNPSEDFLILASAVKKNNLACA